jgi:hypothetical protein
MNIHKSQKFWGALGTRVLTHCHIENHGHTMMGSWVALVCISHWVQLIVPRSQQFTVITGLIYFLGWRNPGASEYDIESLGEKQMDGSMSILSMSIFFSSTQMWVKVNTSFLIARELPCLSMFDLLSPSFCIIVLFSCFGWLNAPFWLV